MPFRRISIFVAFILLAGAGCLSRPSPNAPKSWQPPLARPTDAHEWREVAEGAARITVDLNATTTAILYRFSPEHFTVGLSAEGSSRRVSAWADDLPAARLVVNGVYFDADGGPSGFVSTGGMRLGRRAFDLDKSGLKEFSPEFGIVDTAREPVKLETIPDGAQSYPFYIRNGEPAISRDSGFQARRTFVGRDEAGRFYFGAVVHGEISLYRLMIALEEKTDIRWTDVLNLDGGPSTGLAARFDGWNETADSIVPVPNVLVVREKPEK